MSDDIRTGVLYNDSQAWSPLKGRNPDNAPHGCEKLMMKHKARSPRKPNAPFGPTGSRRKKGKAPFLAESLLSVREVAELLTVSRNSIYYMIASGDLPIVRLGRLVRVPVEEVQRLVARRQARRRIRKWRIPATRRRR